MTGSIAGHDGGRGRFRASLPERLPDFTRGPLNAFRIIWFAAFLLALAGPIAGAWHRLARARPTGPVVAGSHAGFAVADADLTRIRFPVGPEAERLGIRAGDDI